MSVIYSIDGFSLADPAGRWWVTAQGSSHSQGLALRSVDATIPGMSGVPDFGYEPRESAPLELRVMVASRDEAVREARWEAVKALFSQGLPFALGRSVGGVTRTTRAKTRSIGAPDLSARVGALVGVISVSLLDGLFHAAPADVTTAPFNANFAAVSLPHLSGTAPVEDWVIRVKGPFSSVSFTDDATGTGIGYAGPVTAGQWLFIRGVSARMATSATAWDSGGTDVSTGVFYPPAGIMRLTPRPAGADPLVRTTRWSATRAGSTAATELTLRAGGAYA